MTRVFRWLFVVVLAVLVVQWAIDTLTPLIPELVATSATVVIIPVLWTIYRWRRERW